MKMIFSKEKFYATLTDKERMKYENDGVDGWPSLCDGKEVERHEFFGYVVYDDVCSIWFIHPAWCIEIED